MKPIVKLWIASLLFGLFLVKTTHADAPLPLDTPPTINTTEAEDAAVTAHKNEKNEQTTQTIQNGEQTEVRVTNKMGTYIVKPNQHVGNSLPGDAQSSSNHAAQWVVKSWGGSKDTEPNAAPPTLPANPNSPR